MTAPTIVFVCWGNVCRSPMAETVARAHAAREGVTGVTFTSAGISDEEAGNPIDPRAAAALQRAGYDVGDHRAHRITVDETKAASMLIGMEQLHLDRLGQLVHGLDDLYLLSDFDPDAGPGVGIPDPWYGPDAAFQDTLRSIEAAMPEIIHRAKELAASASEP